MVNNRIYRVYRGSRPSLNVVITNSILSPNYRSEDLVKAEVILKGVMTVKGLRPNLINIT